MARRRLVHKHKSIIASSVINFDCSFSLLISVIMIHHGQGVKEGEGLCRRSKKLELGTLKDEGSFSSPEMTFDS